MFSSRHTVLALIVGVIIANTAWAGVVQLAKLTAADGANGDLFGRSVGMTQTTMVVGAPGHDQQVGAAYVFVKPQNGWAHAVQTAKLTASDGQLADFFGSSVAIDGDIVIIGAPGATVNGVPNQGAIYVFTKPPQGWTDMTQTAKLTVPDATSFAQVGQGVAISGNTVVAGAPESLDNNPGPGAAYVFVEPPGGWTDVSQTATLTASNGLDFDSLGFSVAISGNTVALGALYAPYSNQQGPGAIYVFVKPENGWTNMTESAELSASDRVDGDSLGASLSIDEDTIAAGASLAHFSQGAVYVFVKPKSGWRNRTETAEFELSTLQLGVSAAVSGEGKTIVAGAFGDSYPKSHKGAVYAFLKPPQGWKSTSKFNLELQGHPEKNFDDFGFSVAVNGNTAVVGAQYAPVAPPNGAGPGAVYVFGP